MINKSNIKAFTRGCYDLQKLRIETGNRIVANFKSKLGQKPNSKETSIDKEGKMLLRMLRGEYKRIADGAKRITIKNFKGIELISEYAEFAIIKQYDRLLSAEEDGFKMLGNALKTIPVYTDFLQDIKGVGPAMAGVIISEIDISKATYPSSLWKYAGLDVAEDGKGRSRRKEHLVDYEYTDKNGEHATRKGISFNPFLKTKLVGVLGSSFLRTGKDNVYSKIYYNYKNRLQNHSEHKEKTDAHRHNMSIRYMIKRFLVDLYTAWRTIEGLPVSDEYAIAKLGIVHSK